MDDRLIETLRGSASAVFLTGAGVSAESGIPTFRDAMTGLWSRYRPEELATPDGFQRDPELVWRWYEWRRGMVSESDPNPGHHALRRMQHHLTGSLLITQNVDGLHQRAGSEQPIELHGNLFRTLCSRDMLPVTAEEWIPGNPPRCARCDAWVRPGVVWFGEMLPADAIGKARQAAMNCDVFFSIGTSAQVYPAAELAEIALANGATVVEVNPERTALTRYADFVLPSPSGAALPEIARRLGPN